MIIKVEFPKGKERALTEEQIVNDLKEFERHHLKVDLIKDTKTQLEPTFAQMFGYRLFYDVDGLDAKKQQELISQFYSYVNDEDTPHFNFHLIDGRIKSFNNVVEFLQNIGKLIYTEVTVTPF